MTLPLTGPRPMRFVDAILQRSAVVLVRDFVVKQLKVVPANSVGETSDKTAVRFCAFFWLLFFAQAKKSDWPAGQKHPLNLSIH